MNFVLALTMGEIWPMLTVAAGIVFGAGVLVEKIQEKQFVTKEFCGLQHKFMKENFDFLKQELKEIKEFVQGESNNGT